jgi:hypothetical protein
MIQLVIGGIHGKQYYSDRSLREHEHDAGDEKAAAYAL